MDRLHSVIFSKLQSSRATRSRPEQVSKLPQQVVFADLLQADHNFHSHFGFAGEPSVLARIPIAT